MTFPGLPRRKAKPGETAKPLDVCVVSFIPAAKNGGVGTASTALVRQLASHGHRVTLLDTLVAYGRPANVASPGEETDQVLNWQQWVEVMAAGGVRLDHIKHEGAQNAWLEKSWLVREYLASRNFDLVYFNDWQGLGYFTQLAKRAGLLPFAQQLHCVITHAAKQWVCETNGENIREPSDIEVIGMERRSVEMADVLIGPSRYLLRQYQQYGWVLPEQTFSQPHPMIQASTRFVKEVRPIDELVFFGRLEVRKGLWLFCEALDRLADNLRGKTVTFMGPLTHAHGVSAGVEILSRSAKWPFRVRLLTEFDPQESRAYLGEGRRLAVMPSISDNSPCVLYECMEAGIPFVAASGSGGEELVDNESRRECFVAADVNALTKRLASVLKDGATLARPSFDPLDNQHAWSEWHNYIAHSGNTLIRGMVPQGDAITTRGVRPPILVFVDAGVLPLTQVIENVAGHVKRFGALAECLIVSGRGRKATAFFSELFRTATGGATVRIVQAQATGDMREVILSADFAFFLDANTEMLTPFFLQALELMSRNQSAMVTCVGAVRLSRVGAPEIEHLPSGALRGPSILGRFALGPVWSASAAALSANAELLDFYDEAMDELLSAEIVGERLAQRALVEMIPVVGAIVTRPPAAPLLKKPLPELRKAAAAAGIGTSLMKGGPAWFAVSFHADREVQPTATPFWGYGLAAEHPLHRLSSKEDRGQDPSLHAASLGRGELAVQIETSRLGPTDRVNELLDVAAQAERQRLRLDLTDALDRAPIMGYGMAGYPEASPHQAVARPSEWPSSGHPLAGIVVYVEGRLTITGTRLLSVGNLRTGGPAKVLFVDVPLRGQRRLSVGLRSEGPTPLLASIRVLDQDTGEEIDGARLRLVPQADAELTLPLKGIYAHVVVVLEFSGAARMDVNAKRIRLH